MRSVSEKRKEVNKISVVINTYNAEEHLRECLEAVRGFDEVVVCDMESTDHTVAIARERGCRVVTFPRDEHRIVEPAREFAIHQAANDWVLVVDADEIVTERLHDRLYDIVGSDACADGYFISRHNKFMGAYTKSRGHDYILRFFRQRQTTWPPTIHSVPVVRGRVERMPADCELRHLADETMSQWVAKMNGYTDYELAKKAGKNYGIAALTWRPFWRFFKNYVLMGGFRNGRRGLLQSVQWAIYQQVLVSKIIEKRMRNEE